jgi:hypothetical protein
METVAEAVLALASIDATQCTGRILRSLEFLIEFDRPVRTLDGTELVGGWQPADLGEVVRGQEHRLNERGWPGAFGGGGFG